LWTTGGRGLLVGWQSVPSQWQPTLGFHARAEAMRETRREQRGRGSGGGERRRGVLHQVRKRSGGAGGDKQWRRRPGATELQIRFGAHLKFFGRECWVLHVSGHCSGPYQLVPTAVDGISP
jgi:hypothetical protein